MFDAGSIVAHVKADLTDFKKGISTAKEEVGGFGDTVGKVGGAIRTGLIVAGTAAAAGMVVLGKSALEAAGNFEQTKIAFETMLGSASKATKLLSDLQTFAKKTPFNLVELQETTKRLLAYGVEGENVIGTLTTLGNIASAVGRDKMPQLTLAFGQVKAVGRLTGMELRQFAETGVPLLQILSDQFGVTTAEMQEMVSAGEVGFPAVQTALQSLGGEGGKWAGMMDAQSKTLNGSLSNLQDSWTQLLVVLGTAFIPIATQVVQALTGFITPLMDIITGTRSLGEVFGLSGEQTAQFSAILAEFQSFLFDTFLPAVMAVVNMLVAFWNQHKVQFMATWQIIWGFIQIMWALIYGLIKVGLELLAGDWKGAWNAILQMTQGVWNGLKSIFDGALSFIYIWGRSVYNALVQPFVDAWNRISEYINKIKDGLDFTKRHSPSVVDIVQRGVSLVNNALDDLAIGVNPQIGASMAGAGAMVGGGGNSAYNSINIDLSGAIISDEAAAERIGEQLGDSIIKKLQANLRF
jgi:tape measure domain-containing protein